MAKTDLSLDTLQDAAAHVALVAGVSLVSILPAGPEFLPQLHTIFNMYHYYRVAPGSCAAWALVSIQLVGRYQTLTYKLL